MAHEETMREIILQEMNEERFNRKHIDAKIRKEIDESPVMQDKLATAVKLVFQYLNPPKPYYNSKQVRVNQVNDMKLDITALVADLAVGIAYFTREELFTSVTSQLSSRLRFSDRAEAIATVAEITACLCHAEICDINKANRNASLMLVSKINLSQQLVEFVNNSQILPPMVCEPLPLSHNFSSGYLTHNDSLILGSGNHHDGDICLDTLNTMGRVALSLDTEFLSKVEEVPTFELDTLKKSEQWDIFKKQSYCFYSLMAQQGNRFYLNYKVDKRGRAYAHGYHINPQGASFKKAMLEFAEPELVEGVPI
jgi:hypothetical protein